MASQQPPSTTRGSITPRPRWRGRTATACVECRRRKKRCNRQWPCNHCQSRRIAHLCRFAGAPAAQKQAQGPASESNVGEPLLASSGDIEQVHVTDAASSAVRVLSYVESDMFQFITEPNLSADRSHTALDPPEQVLLAARALPPRPYTDILVQNFFDSVNHHYGVLHQSSFTTAYAEWWPQRLRHASLRAAPALAMTCLVLRVCANSAQFLSPTTRSKLEHDLGDSVEELGAGYQAAARAISYFLPPGAGGLANAQQLFLGATWYKAEADFVQSWHELGAAVRQAQEIGVHVDSTPDDVSDFEREMRRRIWCALYTWDRSVNCFYAAVGRFMTATFNRPPIIQDGIPVPLPSPDLDSSLAESDVPPSIVAKILENKLARKFSVMGPDAGLHERLSYVEDWMSSLPPVFAVEGPDRHWDGDYPALAFQRLQLHCVGYMSQLLLLRPFVASSTSDSQEVRGTTNHAQGTEPPLVSRIVDVSLRAMAASKDFFDLCFPQQARYFMVAFCPFDNAALLCSLLLHQPDVPRRPEVVTAIGAALNIARLLRGVTKMGEATWSILAALTSRLSLTPSERRVVELGEGSSGPGATGASDSLGHGSQVGGAAANHAGGGAPEVLQLALEDDWSLLGSTFDGYQAVSGVEQGVLEGVWDWQSLNLDAFMHAD